MKKNLNTRKAMMIHKRIILLMIILFSYTILISDRYSAFSGPSIPSITAILSMISIFIAIFTAYLLFKLLSKIRIPSLAVLGCTYLYVGLINIPYLLTVPRVLAPYGLFNAGLYSPSWFWIFLQIGYPFGILLYVLIHKHYDISPLSSNIAKRFLIIALSIVFVLFILLCFIGIDPYHILPDILSENSPPVFIPQVNILLFSFNGLMFICTLLILDTQSVTHLWLRLSTLLSFINILFSLSTGGRYSVGWYVSKVIGLIAAFVVLCAVLYESQQFHRQITQDLREQSRIQSDFLSIVAHEIRTGLTSVLGFSEMMYTEDLNTQNVKEYAENIYTDAIRLSRLVNDLLDLERMMSVPIKMNRERVEINGLIQEIVNRIHSSTLQNQIQLDLDTNPLPIWGDHDKLTQVIVNLLTNAIKYSPEGGTILVSSKRLNDTIHLFVYDHGIGIPQDKLEQIFEHYTSTTRYIGGTGLGLPIVRQIVEMHQGRVWAESTLGKGSTFHVVLPIDKDTQTTSKTI
jgi:signal transduction histidine kinase